MEVRSRCFLILIQGTNVLSDWNVVWKVWKFSEITACTIISTDDNRKHKNNKNKKCGFLIMQIVINNSVACLKACVLYNYHIHMTGKQIIKEKIKVWNELDIVFCLRFLLMMVNFQRIGGLMKTSITQNCGIWFWHGKRVHWSSLWYPN